MVRGANTTLRGGVQLAREPGGGAGRRPRSHGRDGWSCRSLIEGPERSGPRLPLRLPRRLPAVLPDPWRGVPATAWQGCSPRRILGPLILADATNLDTARSIAYHELTHALVRSSSPDIPLWLEEGLAELYSSFQVTGKDVRIGHPLARPSRDHPAARPAPSREAARHRHRFRGVQLGHRSAPLLRHVLAADPLPHRRRPGTPGPARALHCRGAAGAASRGRVPDRLWL